MKIFTWPNIPTFLRVLLVLPVVWALNTERRFLALGLIVLMGATDVLDGLISRWLHQESRVGRIIDPLADKIAFLSVSVVLGLKGDLPWWFVVVKFVKEVLLGIRGVIILGTGRPVHSSIAWGKIAAVVGFVVLLLVVAGVSYPFVFPLLLCVVALDVVALVAYWGML